MISLTNKAVKTEMQNAALQNLKNQKRFKI